MKSSARTEKEAETGQQNTEKFDESKGHIQTFSSFGQILKNEPKSTIGRLCIRPFNDYLPKRELG